MNKVKGTTLIEVVIIVALLSIVISVFVGGIEYTTCNAQQTYDATDLLSE